MLRGETLNRPCIKILDVPALLVISSLSFYFQDNVYFSLCWSPIGSSMLFTGQRRLLYHSPL